MLSVFRIEILAPLFHFYSIFFLCSRSERGKSSLSQGGKREMRKDSKKSKKLSIYAGLRYIEKWFDNTLLKTFV